MSVFLSEKTRIFKPFALVSCTSIMCFSMLQPRVAVAQVVPNKQVQVPRDLWKSINQADSGIRSCRVVWNRVITVKPNLAIDIERESAKAAELAKQSGRSVEEIAQAKATAKQDAEYSSLGHRVVTTLDFNRVASVVKCDVFSQANTSHAVDFYDGKHALYLPLKSGGQKATGVGLLTLDDKEILSHSAFNWMLPKFLVGIPVSQATSSRNPAFGPKDTILIKHKADALVLEKEAALEPNAPEGVAHERHRLFLDKKHLRPVRYELVEPTGAIEGSVQAKGYRSYKGIFFPSQVTVKTPAFTIDFTLVKAAFNEAVDPMDVRLPPNVRISDARFGVEKVVTYKPKNGLLPSDIEVKQMLGEQKEKAKAAAQAERAVAPSRQASTAIPFAPMVGLLFLACGCVLWRHSDKNEGM